MACKPGSVPAEAGDDHSSRPYVAIRLKQPTTTETRKPALPLKGYRSFGFAPGGVYRAAPVTRRAVRSYRTLSSLPYVYGGLLSVALSLRSPSPAINRHRVFVEPGLSSPSRLKPKAAAIQPSAALLRA